MYSDKTGSNLLIGFLTHDSLEKVIYTELNVPISTKSSYY